MPSPGFTAITGIRCTPISAGVDTATTRPRTYNARQIDQIPIGHCRHEPILGQPRPWCKDAVTEHGALESRSQSQAAPLRPPTCIPSMRLGRLRRSGGRDRLWRLVELEAHKASRAIGGPVKARHSAPRVNRCAQIVPHPAQFLEFRTHPCPLCEGSLPCVRWSRTIVFCLSVSCWGVSATAFAPGHPAMARPACCSCRSYDSQSLGGAWCSVTRPALRSW